MSKQKLTRDEQKFSIQETYSEIGAAVDLLIKAAPGMFKNKPATELQGRCKHRQAA
ncbi:TPA: hypothetical protein RG728_003387 [Morganella morganii subsp. morganii]|uniref:hypothetical protein n=1 Tax=Morganella morganii TaxID=582 RepID=UPI001AD863F0|nr:hypothetical protein [Morganella morganii]MBO8066568.1 hypothetical protein [Morganella morganii]HDU8694232.1 hypothetical protein [Morganella morganii subsp. morganii]